MFGFCGNLALLIFFSVQMLHVDTGTTQCQPNFMNIIDLGSSKVNSIVPLLNKPQIDPGLTQGQR